MATNYSLEKLQEDTLKLSQKLGEITCDFTTKFFPAYNIDKNLIANIEKEENSLDILNSFTLYKICECKIYNIEDKFAYFAEKMQQLFTTAYSIKKEVCYGIISNNGVVSLVIGINPKSNDEINNKTIKNILEGLLPGIKLEKFSQKIDSINQNRYVGCINGIPALKVNDEYQRKDLSSMIRSLNAMNYTIMVICKPVDRFQIQEKINQAVKIKDDCFAISKRTLSLQKGSSEGKTANNGITDTNGTTINNQTGGGLSILIVNGNKSNSISNSQSIAKSYSEAITKSINENESISGEIQNGYALEIMKMAESLIERLNKGRNIGMWESLVTYSSDNEIANNIIQGSLYNNMASGIPEILPPVIFSYEDKQQLIIPKGFLSTSNINNPLTSLVTSEEICGLCNIPVENTFGFNIEEQKSYSLNYTPVNREKKIGLVCEYEKTIPNMPFDLSEDELNKHTFVCGITGSGKTNTVKKILEVTDKPFLVIEPAKKEYRNITGKEKTVYTLGRPEINCIKLNPFYILPGVSPQQHIDILKDLFSASFAFYGPMPYIMEKCLYNIYEKKGWNLTLGFHKYLVNNKDIYEMFDNRYVEEVYSKKFHKYLFPTMQDLKDEIENYLLNDKEMTYEGEVKGNIQGALKARINSLCVGSKGYIFNTNDIVDFKSFLNQNTVIELEGLADDSDKAFAIGLLITYINEYRQINKEISDKQGLQHILVIEEAHRLLKNVSSEHTEELGNPKGKAVEHFTNMLAEMRSYGQGIIVAEQIPNKISIDVIKNSSNKIIHRIVSKDDQEVMANTVGLIASDSIYLGNISTGYAICHKEGMNQPVIVKMDMADSKNTTDANLYHKDLEEKMIDLNINTIKNVLSKDIYTWSVKILLTLMYNNDFYEINHGIKNVCKDIMNKIKSKSITLIEAQIKKERCIRKCIKETILYLMTSGIFRSNKFLGNDFIENLEEIIISNKDKLKGLKELLKKYYQIEPENKAIEIVACLLSFEFSKGKDIKGMANKFLLIEKKDFGNKVIDYLKRRCV